jgi:hypothetical protein
MLRVVSKSTLHTAAVLTLLVLLTFAASEAIKWSPSPDQADFEVYLTAAHLVRHHQGAAIYNSADTGQNPQMHFAPTGSLFQHAATAIGISKVRLYVYPPTLADLLIPFTYLSLPSANSLWLACNILCIALAALLMSWMLFDSIIHIASLGFFVAILCFRSNIWAFGDGQISSVLLLLWTAGIVFYFKGFARTSSILFALATSIKLTPLLVVLPFAVWQEWRWLRWFAVSLVVLAILLSALNGPSTLLDYVLHVMPPMSSGFVSISNISIPSGLQMFYLGLTHHNVQAEYIAVPKAIVFASKLITGGILLAALAAIYRLGQRSPMERAEILAFIALLSLYCSPIAWRSAYGIVFLAAILLWKHAFDRGSTRLGLALLILATLEFSFILDTFFLRFAHGILLASISLVAPATGCALIVYTLQQMQPSPAAWNRA